MDIKKIEYLEVEWLEVEEMIHSEYDLDEWELAADNELNNDTCIRISVDGEVHPAYERYRLDQFIVTRGREPAYNMTRILMNDMAGRGIIPKGEYLIVVSW